MRQALLFMFLITAVSNFAGDLQSDDEIATMRTLWAIAEQGKAATAKEADIVALMTKSWRGRRLAPWCYHALVKIGVPADKHYETFLATARHWEKKPGGASDADYAKTKSGPVLPDDLKPAFTTVWTTAMDIICDKFANADERTVDNYRASIRELDAPKEITVPRVCAILVDPKRTTSQRNVSTMVLSSIGPNEAAIDPLIKTFKDPVARVRGNALSALRSQGAKDPKNHMNVVFKDPEKVRVAVVELMKVETDRGVRSSAGSFLRFLGKELLPRAAEILELAKLKKEGSSGYLTALAQANYPEALPLALAWVSDAVPEFQSAGVYALDAFQRHNAPAAELAKALPALEKIAKESKDQFLPRTATELVQKIKAAK